MLRVWTTVSLVAVVLCAAGRGQQLSSDEPELKRIDIAEKLGETLPTELVFTGENGVQQSLAEILGGEQPVLLTLAWFECPMLCTYVLNGLTTGVKDLSWKPQEKFRLVTISIDPAESAELAKAKGAAYRKLLGVDAGWQFYVGAADQVQALADAVGFKYYYDEEKELYAHPAAVFVIAPDARISRYLYGMQFSSQDLRLSLMEAADGRIGTVVDRLILKCYQYDPSAKGYVLMAGNVMRIGGAVVLAALVTLLTGLWVREIRHTRHSQAAA